jgi:hypothetical protein
MDGHLRARSVGRGGAGGGCIRVATRADDVGVELGGMDGRTAVRQRSATWLGAGSSQPARRGWVGSGLAGR